MYQHSCLTWFCSSMKIVKDLEWFSKVLNGLCAECGLTDVASLAKQQTNKIKMLKTRLFFSNVHNSYSEIDIFYPLKIHSYGKRLWNKSNHSFRSC